jgi:hypothetical protein
MIPACPLSCYCIYQPFHLLPRFQNLLFDFSTLITGWKSIFSEKIRNQVEVITLIFVAAGGPQEISFSKYSFNGRLLFFCANKQRRNLLKVT